MRTPCFFAGLLCASSLALAATPATVELLPQASVGSASVVLGQVARIHSADLELVRKLVNLPLGLAPQPGQSAVVQRSTLAAWTRRQVGPAGDHVDWRGAGEARVLREAAKVKGEQVAEVAVIALRTVLAARGMAGQIHPPSAMRDLDVPSGEVRIEARPLVSVQLRRRMLVWVDVHAGDTFVRTIPVSLDLELAGGMPLRAAAEGDPTASVLQSEQEAPVVTRGEWASLRSLAGAVLLESRVEVLQDGRPGQKIRVRQQGATGIVFARVVGRGELELAP